MLINTHKCVLFAYTGLICIFQTHLHILDSFAYAGHAHVQDLPGTGGSTLDQHRRQDDGGDRGGAAAPPSPRAASSTDAHLFAHEEGEALTHALGGAVVH